MSVTVEQRIKKEDLSRSPYVIHKGTGQPVLTAGVTILKGTIAMLLAGKVIVGTNATAGTTLLGIAEQTYVAGTADTQLDMVFGRGAYWLPGKAGDLPTAAMVSTLIALNDNFSVKGTVAANDVTVKLLEISTDQTLFKVELV
jgi:hypothetical protein